MISKQTINEKLCEILNLISTNDVSEDFNDNGPVEDVLLLACAVTGDTSWGTLACVQDYAERVFCQVNFIESVSDYQED